jgi:hypothetical protein
MNSATFSSLYFLACCCFRSCSLIFSSRGMRRLIWLPLRCHASGILANQVQACNYSWDNSWELPTHPRD